MEMAIVLRRLVTLLVGMFLCTYFMDRKEINGGVCPKCGRKLIYQSRTFIWHSYTCVVPNSKSVPAHIHIATISNPILVWKYNRKLRRKE
jgi:hypothetical protein